MEYGLHASVCTSSSPGRRYVLLVTPSERSLFWLGTVLPGICRVLPLALPWQDTLDVQVHRIFFMQITSHGGLRRLIRSGQSLENIFSNAVDTDDFIR